MTNWCLAVIHWLIFPCLLLVEPKTKLYELRIISIRTEHFSQCYNLLEQRFLWPHSLVLEQFLLVQNSLVLFVVSTQRALSTILRFIKYHSISFCTSLSLSFVRAAVCSAKEICNNISKHGEILPSKRFKAHSQSANSLKRPFSVDNEKICTLSWSRCLQKWYSVPESDS